MDLNMLLVTFRCEAKGTIKKLVQQSQQFEFTIDFYRTAHESLTLQKLPEVLFGENNSPAEIGQRNSLRGPPFPNSSSTSGRFCSF